MRAATPPAPLASGTTAARTPTIRTPAASRSSTASPPATCLEYFDPVLDHNGAIVRGHGYFADDITDHAIAFIEEHAAHPFFCYVPYNTPHAPMQVPDRFYDKFAGAGVALRGRDPERENLDHTRAVLAMMENLDWNVGRLLDKLGQLDLAGETIVVYFSDNGPNGWRWNAGLKGRKGSTDEGGVRSPLFIRWPGYIHGGNHVSHVAAAIDLLPTLAELAGISVFADARFDGMSLKPLLRGSGRDWPARTILTYWLGSASARTDRYRLDRRDQLFDMDKDPGQSHDIAAEEPGIVARLKPARDHWAREMYFEIEGKNRPYTVGFSPLTLLPARDAIGHGAIRRSSRDPNGSYFTDWTSTGDRLTWYIHVGQAGDYEATVYYTCPEADIGSTIELSFRGESTKAKVAEAHNPPLEGADQDRVPRETSYTKDFRPLKIGSIRLEQTRGQLTLRATAIPGRQVMDIESIALRRLE